LTTKEAFCSVGLPQTKNMTGKYPEWAAYGRYRLNRAAIPRGIHVLSYNMKHAINILTVPGLLQAMRKKGTRYPRG
jgi:hypothetical protein